MQPQNPQNEPNSIPPTSDYLIDIQNTEELLNQHQEALKHATDACVDVANEHKRLRLEISTLQAAVNSAKFKLKNMYKLSESNTPKKQAGRPRKALEDLAPSTRAQYAKLARAQNNNPANTIHSNTTHSNTVGTNQTTTTIVVGKNRFEEYLEKYEGVDERNAKQVTSYIAEHGIEEARQYFIKDLLRGSLKSRQHDINWYALMGTPAAITFYGAESKVRVYNTEAFGPQSEWLKLRVEIVQIVNYFNNLLQAHVNTVSPASMANIQ